VVLVVGPREVRVTFRGSECGNDKLGGAGRDVSERVGRRMDVDQAAWDKHVAEGGLHVASRDGVALWRERVGGRAGVENGLGLVCKRAAGVCETDEKGLLNSAAGTLRWIA